MRGHADQAAVRGYTIKDSGERREFASGMVRDTTTGKPDVERIFDGPMADRWAEHLTNGATKYPDVKPGTPNWTLASGVEELVRFRKSAARHFRQWLRGDTDEDHASAIFFNVNGYEYVKKRMAAEPVLGSRPPEFYTVPPRSLPDPDVIWDGTEWRRPDGVPFAQPQLRAKA